MNTNEKLALIEECMDLDEGTLQPDNLLDDFEEWDSVSALSIIAMIDEQFKRSVSGNDLKKANKVADILALME